MFKINNDLSIEITRGDAVEFVLTAQENEENYVFKTGDIVRFKVFEKKGCDCVVLQKDFGVESDTEEVTIVLEEADTKIGELINKPKDYWYEVELNPDTLPSTIIGYDEAGAKVFKLYPEGRDLGADSIKPEDIPFVDKELDMTSHNPVENQAIAKEFVKVNETIRQNAETATAELSKKLSLSGGTMTGNLSMGGKSLTGLADPVNDEDAVRLGYANKKYAPKSHTEDKENPHNVTAAQVGARPNTWTPTASDVGALNLYWIEDSEHQIQTGDDLDDYVVPDAYQCITSTRAASLVNGPNYRGAGFRLIVSATSHYSAGVIQIAIFNTTTLRIEARVQTNEGNFGSWHKLFSNGDTIPIENGGTDATSAEEALTNLGAGRKPTELWTGSWSSGTVTVENTGKYRLFQIGMSGQGTTVIAAKSGTHIRGIGGYSTADLTINLYQFTATFSGNTWTFVACNSMVHTPDGSHASAISKTVTSIYGLC